MSNNSTRINVTQVVESAGGQIIGTSINHLAGNLIIDSIRDDPPDERSVIAYLKHIKEPSLPLGVPESVQKLWQLPFRAHVPGEVAGEAADLQDAVLAGFERNRRLGRGRRVVLLADAGMGKTRALKHLRARWAQQSIRSYESHSQARETDATARFDKESFKDSFVVPLMINLADLTSNTSLYSLVHEAFNAIVIPDRAEGVNDVGLDQIPAFLNNYRCLMLFDGLDELISNRRGGGLHPIRRFMDTHPEQLYVISCRTSSYREQLGAIEILYLNDLEETQAEEVLGAGRYRQLSQSLRQLARNRSLLSHVLELEEDASLLENKGQLLQLRMQQRLKPADGDDSRDRVDVSLLQRLLEHLAIALHRDHTLQCDERRAMEVTRACLEAWHEKWHWRQVLQVLQDSGVLKRDDAQGQWRFVERSDQAYFAAAAILAHPEHLDAILNEVSDYWWREMFEVLVGLLPDPTALFFELMDRDALVAANSIQYAGRTVHDHVTNAVVDALVVRMGEESSTRCKYIVQRIGESDHPRAPEALFLALHREWSSMVVRGIAKALFGWWQRHPQTNLANAERDAIRFLRREMMPLAGIVKLYRQALAPDDDSRAKARQKLLDSVQDRQQPARARGLAAIYLGLLAAGNGDEALWQPLLELFEQPDADDFVAWCVTEALTECRTADAERMALSFRQDKRYRTKKWRHHRARATYLLGWVSRDESTCQLLWSALKDRDPLVRGFAIDAISRLDLPQAREEIQRLMTGDARRETDPDVLRRMAEALSQIGTVDSIPVLQQYLWHERTYTRWAMHKAIDEIRERYGL
jgi:hypothetical protein